MATTKKTSASEAKKRKPVAGAKRAPSHEPSLWTIFRKSKLGKLLGLVLLLTAVVVICLALFGDQPSTFFQVLGVCILLYWGGLVIYSLVRRRDS